MLVKIFDFRVLLQHCYTSPKIHSHFVRTQANPRAARTSSLLLMSSVNSGNWPTCSCSHHIYSLCRLTTLTIHNSLSLSLPVQDLPLSQIFPTIDSTDFTTGPFLLSISVFTARRNARIASAVLRQFRPSIRPSVCHTPVLCQNDCT